MSSYIKTTKNPKTGKWEEAVWLDDYFGHHRYGVKFHHEIELIDPEKVQLETKE